MATNLRKDVAIRLGLISEDILLDDIYDKKNSRDNDIGVTKEEEGEGGDKKKKVIDGRSVDRFKDIKYSENEFYMLL